LNQIKTTLTIYVVSSKEQRANTSSPEAAK
jgi:hypothetical protein